ncbi:MULTISPECIES: hypothetical protein [Streptomyces]|uniref:Uncharacterized protein n=1 Tax=Streptomyces olivaceus TaxID=47716 RepID=A0ABS7W193_STROV|nr:MULTISPECIES: hypothetical protein [Streptomyces]AOW90744.1 hypothetical protein BC342_34155 [Streptomyces olivaceus]MBF8169776.1 hypothetical protein [Streptomyces olivaceus]MBZ6084509.1 hypothetical protein [Streptomyces olivaceus]MBZ6088413.1 hypothetical protein [Streptomyces olivaceus]MBZ6094750.1 hypothetical protein [Streptomyces olivaceus]
MDIPRRLIELRRAVDAADNRYRSNSGENATVALAVWSDATAALARGIAEYAEETGTSRQELERAVEEAAGPRTPPAPRRSGPRPRHAIDNAER